MGARDSLLAGLREAASRGRQTLSSFAGERLQDAETLMLALLKRREHDRETPRLAAPAPPAPPRERPGTVLHDLLARSSEQSPDEARTTLFLHLLRDLVPDEARILAALSDSSSYPLMHVDAGTRLGGASRRVLANLSTVGKQAGVAWTEMTPAYVGRLIARGLAVSGPEDEAFEVPYEILATDEIVRITVDRIRKHDRLKETLVRGTLSMSTLGRALWTACASSEVSG